MTSPRHHRERDAPGAPWYREPWPWLLIGLFAAVVVASLVTVYLAVTHPDPLVPRTGAVMIEHTGTG